MSTSGRRNVTDEVECPVCAEPFVEPRQLPCNHVYCVECLERWVFNDGQCPRLTCPTCRVEFQLPEHGEVRDLPAPVPDIEDPDNVDMSDFEIVSVDVLDNQPPSDQPETSNTQTDNSWNEDNTGDVTDDAINRNITVSSTFGDANQLDNEIREEAPEELQENEPGNEVMEVRCMKTVEASVGAVTSLNDEVFVALNDSRQIHVYHAEDLHFVRCLPVEGLGTQVYGLAACSVAELLYISDWDNDSVHAVPLTADDQDEDSTSWDVANQPAGLSFTLGGPPNVLVACHGAGKIQEWSPEGILIRQIQLADEAKLVWHAVQLTATQMLVSHEGSQHRIVGVSIDDGQVIGSCDQVDAVQLQYPRSIALDRDLGRVLVADQCNNRIVVAENDLSDPRQVELNLNQGLAWPYGLHLDQDRRRLYVTEWSHGRILRVDFQ